MYNDLKTCVLYRILDLYYTTGSPTCAICTEPCDGWWWGKPQTLTTNVKLKHKIYLAKDYTKYSSLETEPKSS